MTTQDEGERLVSSELDRDEVMRAAVALEQRVLDSTAVILTEPIGLGVRFVGPEPDAWQNVDRPILEVVLGTALSVTPTGFLMSVLENREISNPNEVSSWIPDVRAALPETSKLVRRNQRSLLDALDEVGHGVVVQDGLQLADIRFRRNQRSRALGWGAVEEEDGLVVRLNVAELSYLIEQLTAIREELQTESVADGDS